MFWRQKISGFNGFNSGFYETISCPVQRLSEIYLAEDSRLYLADFFYDPTILWLFTSQELYDTMDDRLKMVLAESAAYLVGTIDEGRLAEIDTGREKLIQAGAEVTRISATAPGKGQGNPEGEPGLCQPLELGTV